MFLLPYRDENTTRSFPLFTLLLIAVNIYAYFVLQGAQGPLLAAEYGFSPGLLLQRPSVMLTSLFLHGSIWHLAANMWFLWLFGDNIEDRFGRLSFLLLYLLSGIAGNFVHFLFSLLQTQLPVIGASGAVAGLMGTYLYKFPRARLRCVFLLVFYPIFLRIRAFWFIGLWMLAEFFAAYLTPTDYIAHWAHVGGFAFGFSWAIGRRESGYRSKWS
jgi:membrane associated rhomboid family serine protease